MKKKRILIVEDDQQLNGMLRYLIGKEDILDVTAVHSAEEAAVSIKKWAPDLIILDLMLPGMNGYELCDILKSGVKTKSIKIIMLTRRKSSEDIEKGLTQHEADDYVTKPFCCRELIARINVQLRGNIEEKKHSEIIRIKNLVIDMDAAEVLVNDKLIELNRAEYDILCILAEKPGRAYSREYILSQIRGTEYQMSDRSVDKQIYYLRKSIKDAKIKIGTRKGYGYRIEV